MNSQRQGKLLCIVSACNTSVDQAEICWTAAVEVRSSRAEHTGGAADIDGGASVNGAEDTLDGGGRLSDVWEGHLCLRYAQRCQQNRKQHLHSSPHAHAPLQIPSAHTFSEINLQPTVSSPRTNALDGIFSGSASRVGSAAD